MTTYRVTHRYIVTPDGRYEEGDVIEDPSDQVVESFSDKLVEVDEESDADLPDPSDYTIDEFEELLDGGQYDAYLDELEEAEKDNDDRDGILSIIEERE